MRTRITIEVEHDRPLPHLANMVAGRAWNIDGVTRAEVVADQVPVAGVVGDLQRAGFSPSEIALGMTEVVRGS